MTKMVEKRIGNTTIKVAEDGVHPYERPLFHRVSEVANDEMCKAVWDVLNEMHETRRKLGSDDAKAEMTRLMRPVGGRVDAARPPGFAGLERRGASPFAGALNHRLGPKSGPQPRRVGV